jgi:ATP-dependent Lon protease
MIKVEDAFDRSGTGTAMLRKRSLEAIGAHQLFDARKVGSLAGLNEETKVPLERLRESGPLRRFMPVPEDYVARSRELEKRFPNFSRYINEHLLPSLALAHVRNTGMQLQPMVFCGSPGVGKTMFVGELAAAFDLEFERVNLETAQASMQLVGTGRGWSNAQPGLLFRWIANSEFANGVIVMEELDKSDTQKSRYSTSNALLQLLEPTTARVFADQSLPELKLDLSKINFLFTANTVDGISEPILSRLQVFNVPDLTAAQARAVALRQYEDMIEELRLPISAPKLTDEGLATLSVESPRRQRILLQLAIGIAVFKKASELQIQPTQKVRKGIGFTC